MVEIGQNYDYLLRSTTYCNDWSQIYYIYKSKIIFFSLKLVVTNHNIWRTKSIFFLRT